MTAFTGPFHIKRAFSEGTVLSVDDVGSAQFEGAAVFASAVTFNQAVSVAGATVLGGALTVNGALSAANTFVAGSTLRVVGTMTAQGNVDVSGRVRTASHPLLGAASVTVNAASGAGASGASREVAIPAGAHITDIRFTRISNEFATAAADVNVLIGTSGDDNQYAILAASGGAPPAFGLGHANFTAVSGAALHAKAAGGVFVKTTAVSGAVTAKDALITFHFARTV